MKRLFSMTLAACILIAASACSSDLDPGQGDSDVKGEVLLIDDYGEEHQRVLVGYAADPRNHGTGKVWLILSGETELLKQQTGSLRRVSSDALAVGQNVRGWTSDVWLYSKPPQAGARRVVIDK